MSIKNYYFTRAETLNFHLEIIFTRGNMMWCAWICKLSLSFKILGNCHLTMISQTSVCLSICLGFIIVVIGCIEWVIWCRSLSLNAGCCKFKVFIKSIPTFDHWVAIFVAYLTSMYVTPGVNFFPITSSMIWSPSALKGLICTKYKCNTLLDSFCMMSKTR